jgi:tagaturonate epimerase
MGLTENRASGLLALNGLDVRPNSVVRVDGAEVGLTTSGQRVAIAGLAHLKTAGTSYLEALRTVAALDPRLFRDVYDYSCTRYEEDRASYHVSASLEQAVQSEDVPDEELPALLERFDEREILHVTFGSVLREASFRDRLMGLLVEHADHYAAGLEKHFMRHLKPFANGGSR